MMFLRNISVDRPKISVLISLLLTVLVAFGIKSLVIDDDFFKMFPKDMHSRLLWEDMTDEFGDSEFLFIAFGEKENNIYNVNLLNTVKSLTSELEQIDIVDKVISLFTIDRIDVDPEDQEELFIEKLFPNDIISNQDIINAQAYLNKNPDTKSRLVSNDEKFTAIAIRSFVMNNDNTYRNNTDLMKKVAPITERYLEGYNVHYAGNPYITGAVPELIKSDASRLILAGLFIMVLLLYLNIRNIKAVMIILMVIVLSLVSMNGFMGWMFYLTGDVIFNFTMISTSMPIVLLTIANSDGVHVVTHFFKQLRTSPSKKEAVNSTMNSLGLPIFLT